MKVIDRYRSLMAGKLPLFTLILVVIQPLMDVLSFWVLKFGISNTVTLLLRLLVLAFTVLTAFILSDRKKVYYAAAVICVVIGLCHIAACVQAGYQNVVSDLSNYVRVLLFPLTTLSLITFIRQDEGCYDSMKKGIALNILIILAVQILAVVTGTEPHTYTDGAGYIGWFSNTNTQSSILTMAAPVAVCSFYQKRGLKSVWFWISLLGSGLSMFFIGTRLAYAGIVVMCFGLGISTLICRLKDWKKAVCFLLVGILFILLLPYAPMTGHRQSHADEMEQKQGWLDVALDNPEEPEEPEEPEDDTPPLAGEPLDLTPEQQAQVERLAPVYEHYLSDFVAVFGVERTIHMFNYTEDIVEMTNSRTKKLMVAEYLMDHSPLSATLFGLELSRFTIKGYIYDVENDFHGIYYLYGILGLAALLLFIAWFLFLIVKALIKNFRRYFTLEAAAWGIALIMGLGHCVFTAGVLRRPSASFYLAMILAGVYYLVKLKQYPDAPGEKLPRKRK